MPENLFTVAEVAERLKVTPTTIRRWLKRQWLTGIETTAGWRISDQDLADWDRRNRSGAGVKQQRAKKSTEAQPQKE